VIGADVMMGNDPHCFNWIKKYREPIADGENKQKRERRRNRSKQA
jgi:5-methyltetrahydrofolate--homocysteine methyltransferase